MKYKGQLCNMQDNPYFVTMPTNNLCDDSYQLLQEIEQDLDIMNRDDIKPTQYVEKSGNHGISRVGQDKLYCSDLLSVLQYIHKFKTMPKYVIIAGGGGGPKGGLHFLKLIPELNLLANKFQVHTEWWLYDPAGFDPELRSIAEEHRVHLMDRKKGWFNENIAREWHNETKGEDVLFLSDVRNTKKRNSNPLKATEKLVRNDMTMQEEWVNQLQPVMAVLKFRAPYAIEFKNPKTWFDLYHAQRFNFDYLQGQLLFEVFDRPNSTEMRLVLYHTEKGFSKTTYDARKIEQKCAGFNHMWREHGNWDRRWAKHIKELYNKLLEP